MKSGGGCGGGPGKIIRSRVALGSTYFSALHVVFIKWQLHFPPVRGVRHGPELTEKDLRKPSEEGVGIIKCLAWGKVASNKGKVARG